MVEHVCLVLRGDLAGPGQGWPGRRVAESRVAAPRLGATRPTLVLDNVSLCAGINALLLAVAVSVEDSNKALVGAGDALEQLEKPFVPVGLLIIMLAGLADLPLEDECPKACPPRPVLPMGMRIWNVLRFQDSFFFPTSSSPTFLKL